VSIANRVGPAATAGPQHRTDPNEGTLATAPITAAPTEPMRQPFHGRRIVIYASIAVAMTAPGQTPGVSPFIDHVMAELDLSRSAVSTAYLIGTLCGAAALPLVGLLVDRYGPRKAMLAIAATFGFVLIGLSLVTEVVGLTAGFVGIRLAGQGALGLAAVTVTAYWFQRRRGTMLGVVSAVGGAGITMSPVVIERLIAHLDWRTVWFLEGLAVWAIVIPIALFGIRNRPQDVGQLVDGNPALAAARTHERSGTRAEALRTPYFWVLAAGTAVVAMLVTAVVFHQIDLLGMRGLTTAQAATNFLPQTAAALGGTLLLGYLVDRLRRPQLLIVGAMGLLAAALASATVVAPGWSALCYGAAIGASMGGMKAVETALTPRLFGTAHLGSIRGIVAAIGVGGTALGPVLFAVAKEASGGYTAILLTTTVLPLAVCVAALVTPMPPRASATGV
jgi:MFS family permease